MELTIDILTPGLYSYEDTEEKIIRFNKSVVYMKKVWGNTLMENPAYNPNLTLECEDFTFAWHPRNTGWVSDLSAGIDNL